MNLLTKLKNMLNSRRVKLEFSVAAGLLLAVVLSDFGQFNAVCSTVREDTLRLHILANSDTKEDQELKLAVRDEILRTAGGIFAQNKTKQQALCQAEEQMQLLQQTAQRTVWEHGYDYPVKVCMENQYFRTGNYDGFTLPAGRYDALRVEIGAHEGHNWFCVLFPPMCVPAACTEQGLQNYTEEQRETVTGKYTVKFAAAEFLSYLKESLSEDRSFYENDRPITKKSREKSGAEADKTVKVRHKAD